MNYYVEIQPNTLFPVATQKCVPTGKTRTRADGEIEAEFIPLDKGYYKDKFWAVREQLRNN